MAIRSKLTGFRLVLPQIVILDGGTTEVTTPTNVRGIIRTIVTTLNDNTNNVTATVTINDEDDAVLSSTAAIPENAKTVTTGINAFCAGDLTIGVTPSADPGASTLTADIVLYGEK